ncbi:MAG: hypothetical protein LBQ66_06170 [Planctomycetaceae bacterium]|nr:hypothetical protein [Planctomycetaceae bacterium]
MIHWRRNRPAVGYPPYVCRHVLAFSSNLFGSITHRGGRDARVPVPRRFAAKLCGITRAGRPRSSPSPLRGKIVWYNKGGTPAFQSTPLRGKIVWYNEGGTPAFQSLAASRQIVCYNAGVAANT